MRRPVARLAVTLGLVLVGPVIPALAVAQAGQAPREPAVRLDVQAIHARPGTATGSAPKALADRLRKAFPGYGTFDLLATHLLELSPGKAGTARLPNDRELTLTYLGPADRFLKLRVDIPPRLRTEVRVNDGGTFYQAGMDYRGGVLILAIRAKRR